MRENRKIVPGLAGTKKVSRRRDTKEPIQSRKEAQTSQQPAPQTPVFLDLRLVGVREG